MKTIAIVSQKGGAGKTTLALHLAVAAELDRRALATVLIDLDPQASAAKWGDSREKESPVVVSAQASRLEKVIDTAKNAGAKLAVIDTAPHSENAALAAIRAADLILLPCRPAILDLRAISDSIDLINLAKKSQSAFVVLNAVPPRGSVAEEAEQAIGFYKVPVAPFKLGQRIAFDRALTGGLTAQEYEPKGQASTEIEKLYHWIRKQVGL